MEKHEEIKALLEKYYEGLTSTDEERRLRDFFADVPGDLTGEMEDACAMFRFFAARSGENCDIKPVALTRARRSIGLLRRTIAIATCIAAICTAGAIVLKRQADKEICVAYIDGHKITDPAQVMREYDRIMEHIAHQAYGVVTRSSAMEKADRAFAKMDINHVAGDKIDRAFALLSSINEISTD